MSTLPKFIPSCNKNMEVSATGGALSVDGGMVPIVDFLSRSHFTELFDRTLSFKEDRKRIQHTKESILKQVLLQQIAGYAMEDAADSLKNNALFTQLMEKETLASQPTLSRMFTSMTSETVLDMEVLNQKYIDQYYGRPEVDTIVIDLDSTHCDTFGHQEKSDFNSHYRTFGYHPLVAFDAITGLFLKSQLRSGNVYTSTGVVEFIEPLLQHLLDDLHIMNILIRGDSGFAVPDLYKLCERYDVKYVIRLKANAVLHRYAKASLHLNHFYPCHKAEQQSNDFYYRAGSWDKDRRVVVINERAADSFLFFPTWIVTNLEDLVSEVIIQMYKARGKMENFIKEAKLGFFMDKTDSSSFVTNEGRMMISVLTYNIIQMMKIWVLPESMKNWTIATIRTRLIKVATKVVSHARKISIKLDETHVYLKEFFAWTQALSTFSC